MINKIKNLLGKIRFEIFPLMPSEILRMNMDEFKEAWDIIGEYEDTFEECDIMNKKKVTVKELSSYLLRLIEKGDGDKTVKLSVNYNHCDHVQELHNVHNFEGLNWITLDGSEDE